MQKIINILKGYEHKIRYESKTHQLIHVFWIHSGPCESFENFAE